MSIIGNGAPSGFTAGLVVSRWAFGSPLALERTTGSSPSTSTPARSWSGRNPASRAIVALTSPSVIRFATTLARRPSVPEPFGDTSTTCESGVSTRILPEAIPTSNLRLSGGSARW